MCNLPTSANIQKNHINLPFSWQSKVYVNGRMHTSEPIKKKLLQAHISGNFPMIYFRIAQPWGFCGNWRFPLMHALLKMHSTFIKLCCTKHSSWTDGNHIGEPLLLLLIRISREFNLGIVLLFGNQFGNCSAVRQKRCLSQGRYLIRFMG